MDLSKELLTSRADYFEALDTGEDVRLAPRLSGATRAPHCIWAFEVMRRRGCAELRNGSMEGLNAMHFMPEKQ